VERAGSIRLRSIHQGGLFRSSSNGFAIAGLHCIDQGVIASGR